MSKKNYQFIPKKAGDIYYFGQLVGGSYAIEYANIIEKHFGFVLIVTEDTKIAFKIFDEISQFSKHPIYYFPDWETVPYSKSSPSQKVISDRISTLYKLPKLKHGILIVSITTLMQRICPSYSLFKNTLLIKQGKKLSDCYLKEKLEQFGYKYVNQIIEQGEFNFKNDSFINLFPIGHNQLYRIDLIDNYVNNICKISFNQQKIIDKVSEINLFPKHELPINKNSLKLFCKNWEKFFNTPLEKNYIYTNISRGIIPSGIEYWYPLFFDQPLSTLFNYLSNNTIIIHHSNLQESALNFWNKIHRHYDNSAIFNKYLLHPNYLWINPNYLLNQFNKLPQIKITNTTLPKKENNINLGYKSLPSLILTEKGDKKISLERLDQFIKKFNGYITFCVKDKINQKKIQKLLTYIKLNPSFIKDYNLLFNNKFTLIISKISNGFIDISNNRAFICERDILNNDNFNIYDNDKIQWKTLNIAKSFFKTEKINYGQPVVHLEHGIGLYMGLTTIETNGINSEYLILIYANDTKLYVPVTSLHLINCYTGHSSDNVTLHKLGSDNWLRSRKKAIEKIHDVAAELLDIYCNRKLNIGYCFKYNKQRYKSFCNDFPFNITLDQQKAINDILGDMCQPIAMDRLICGDAGFGKTEVAMHSAFIAIENNKQVSILVPTTILAQQHYENFKNRFSSWSIKIEILSDFKNFKDQEQILEKIKKGELDIVIGTHKLLNKNIKWKNLGLLIIDEEHRFGVFQKEQIKARYNNIDIVTLTATPIPRTLYMAITGIRDISIITTPPDHRLPVKVFITEFNYSIIREVILREISRGGQVYYLHNKISDIEKIANYINQLVPEANVAIAHGQMHEYDLKKVMKNFYYGHFNILVCTTIIESGIDIPNANTIIIEQADHFGLAQLYQLRGRVGRLHYQAYAWLLTPNKKITKEAKKRFEVIESLKELGTGFTVSTNDLEIRGSGELLGEKQSGQIETLGLSLYTELLENSINDLKNNNLSLENLLNNNIEIELQIPSLIPDKFIENTSMRLSIYKKIARAKNEYELEEIKNDIINNFGLLPDSTNNLFDIASLRLQAHQLGLCKIKMGDRGGYINFLAKNNINTLKLVNLIQKEPNKWKLEGNTKLRFYFRDGIKEQNSRIKWIKNFINSLKY
ncbi:transcription-repair coupling factor [Candidatus Pantoea edessiphila]|uniref:Transcription-repair-coupling factor n=1 Tax=Candidatus Pantoea edessiphila TaxID=2044610 RepID=A0A2P5T0M4_9GAMM|nr:transcription-repair coupling factor [Candidatus Pantoea edessiphila]PPI88110.1 transcription-repair coupling factor [Candidatus Pantoea edessiphila]